MARVPKPGEPITIERVERALDKLAEAIVLLGDDGVNVLPLYDRLESELATMKAHESRMEEIRARAARSKRQRKWSRAKDKAAPLA